VNCLGSTKPCRAVSPHGGALCCSAHCLSTSYTGLTNDTVDAAVDCVWTARPGAVCSVFTALWTHQNSHAEAGADLGEHDAQPVDRKLLHS
jgi:hypothetical protein